MSGCGPACGYCGRCEHTSRIERACDRCGDPIWMSVAECRDWPGPVCCDRCRTEAQIDADERRQKELSHAQNQ